MGVRGKCPLKLKKFCHLEVKFAVFWHKKTTRDFVFVFVFVFVVNFVFVWFFCCWSKCSSRGNSRYRGKGYCLQMAEDSTKAAGGAVAE